VLLRHFGSVARLRTAAPGDIAEVRGIGPALAAAIVARLGPSTGSADEPESGELDEEQRADA
jgi:excinuclease ABC subunit C